MCSMRTTKYGIIFRKAYKQGRIFVRWLKFHINLMLV